jgi:hypothetical protein
MSLHAGTGRQPFLFDVSAVELVSFFLVNWDAYHFLVEGNVSLVIPCAFNFAFVLVWAFDLGWHLVFVSHLVHNEASALALFYLSQQILVKKTSCLS